MDVYRAKYSLRAVRQLLGNFPNLCRGKPWISHCHCLFAGSDAKRAYCLQPVPFALCCAYPGTPFCVIRCVMYLNAFFGYAVVVLCVSHPFSLTSTPTGKVVPTPRCARMYRVHSLPEVTPRVPPVYNPATGARTSQAAGHLRVWEGGTGHCVVCTSKTLFDTAYSVECIGYFFDTIQSVQYTI